MKFSKYNIFSKIKNSENYYLINLLSGNADVINPEKADEIIKENYNDIDEYISKGYIIEKEEEEERKFKMSYLNFLDEREKSEIQIFFVTNYSCNFSCSYCYQDEYNSEKTKLSKEIIDSFFSYIETKFAGRQKYITVFGGEPLIANEEHKNNLEYFLKESKKRNIDIAIVTNGFNLSSYIDIFKEAVIREVQITLDGTETIHNNRRPLKNGKSTFNEIVEGIDLTLKSNIPVNLRMVIDKENIESIPELADFAIKKGWTENPLFKTQFGRNYELHHCQSGSTKLFDRTTLYEEIYNLLEKHPQIMKFHKPAFSISKFLFENGELPEPLFDSCPACKTEWAFDYTGKIYPCTATVGKEGETIGSFYPEVFLNEELIEEWEDRDVTTIDNCKDCSVQLACGGGCGSVAKNSNGKILSPDCRPVKNLLELGISHYFEKEKI